MVELKTQPFVESSIETMDTAVYTYINKELNLYTMRNGKSEKIPVLWSSAERAFQIKKNKELRDNNETLIYPLITVTRETIEKDTEGSPFTPGSNYFAIARRIVPSDTQKFANAHSKKKFGINNKNFKNSKVVYETLYSENVIAVVAKYNLMIKTSYLTDMNQIVNAFLTITNWRNVKIKNENHTYYMTFPTEFSFDKISESLEDDERYFETSLVIEARGALFPRQENINDAVIKSSQNAVNIKFNKERTIMGEIPQVTNGAKSFVEE